MEEKEQEIGEIQALLDSINDERVLHILLESDKKTLQMLLLKMMGVSVAEIAVRLGISERAIYCRMDRLKKKIKKFSSIFLTQRFIQRDLRIFFLQYWDVH